MIQWDELLLISINNNNFFLYFVVFFLKIIELVFIFFLIQWIESIIGYLFTPIIYLYIGIVLNSIERMCGDERGWVFAMLLLAIHPYILNGKLIFPFIK